MTTPSISKQLTLNPLAEAKAKTSAARLSIIVAAFLILLKVFTGWYTGSISVWASLLDSAMDIFASMLNFFAVRAASRPPDDEHTYGHGKVESLAGLFQALVIALSAAYLIYEAVNRIIEPKPTNSEWLGATAMLVAAGVSVLLVSKLRRTARLTDSPALHSEAAHYASDIYTNIAALFALVLTAATNWQLADPIISISLSLYILWFAVGVGREAADVLMDRRLPTEIDETVAQVVGRFHGAGVIGFHALRTRSSGSQKFIEFHLEVERNKKFEESHEITVNVIRAVEDEIPRSRVQIHTDPWG